MLIADDHHLFRDGLARILNDLPQIIVVASVENGDEAIRKAEELKPDVILMDVNMPHTTGVEATRQIHARQPEIKIVMLTISEREDDLFEAIRAGARGYLLKSATSNELMEAIQHVQAGEAMIAPAMAMKLMEMFAAQHTPTRVADAVDDLTGREHEVLGLVAQGLSNKEIGAQLSLSPHTIKAHLRTILDKLHLRSRAEAAAWAARHDTVK
ncbi:MAG: response regulator transcription factor [Chloroflexi bacterium]|nr:response regulator transcription factor [Chloroflexota bacterium]